MSNNDNTINDIFKKGAETSTYAKAYIDNQIKIKQIEASKVGGKSISGLLTFIVATVSATGIFFFLLAAFSVFLNNILGSFVYAFLAIAGIILLILLVFLIIFKPLIKKYSTKLLATVILGESLPTEENITKLKDATGELKDYLKDTADEIPALVKNINPKDLIPEKIVITKSENPSLKDKTLAFVVNKALKKIKSKK